MDKVDKAVLIATILMIVFCVWGVVVAANRSHELMQQCLRDGKKEYECHAYVYGGMR